MPVWLDILLNLSGYAGFVAIATRPGERRRLARPEPGRLTSKPAGCCGDRDAG